MNVSGRLGDKGNQDEPDNADNVMAITNSDAAQNDDAPRQQLNAGIAGEPGLKPFNKLESPLRPTCEHMCNIYM
jgi:hypothetical protein